MATDVAVARGSTRLPDAAPRLSRRLGLQDLAMVPILIGAVVVGAFVSDAFLTFQNGVNILQQSSELAVLVVAQAVILIAGKFDLSLESIVGLAPMVGAWVMLPQAAAGAGLELPPAVGLLVTLLVGVAVGVINAMIVVKLRLNAFIVTLAMLILLRGVTLGIANGATLYGLPASFLWLGSAELLSVPVSVWVAALVFATGGLVLRFNRYGRSVYAIGGNVQAARAAGIPVDRVLVSCYVIGGLLAAVAGIMLTGRIASVTAAQGQNMIFTVFAAAVIGGISLNGGRGRMIGALTGVLVLGVISNILTLSQVASYWIDASFGAIILAALIIARITGAEPEAD
jgi:simple sugar transport system permease protein